MMVWWDSLSELERIFAAIAIPATLILLIQTILLLFGLGGHEGDLSENSDQEDLLDHDPGLRIFTVRGFVSFFSIFGWAGIVCLKSGMGIPLSLAISVILGFISMVVIALAFVGFMKLQSDGTANINSAIGSTATVYISIPPKRTGKGQITVLLGGAWSTCDACTDCDRKINTEEMVTVVAVTGENTLVVMPI